MLGDSQYGSSKMEFVDEQLINFENKISNFFPKSLSRLIRA